MFPWGSQRLPQVPKLFLNTFPIAPLFYPIWFCPKFNYHAYKLERQAIGEHIYFYVATWGLKGCLMFQKNWWWANEYGPSPPPLKKGQHELIHERINMNHAMSLCYVAAIRNLIAGTVNWHVNNFCLGRMWRFKTLFQGKRVGNTRKGDRRRRERKI